MWLVHLAEFFVPTQTDCFADRVSTGNIILIALDVMLDELWRDQLDCMPKSLQPTSPVMDAAASLQTNEAWLHIGGKRRYLVMSQLLSKYYSAFPICAENLEYVRIRPANVS